MIGENPFAVGSVHTV